MVLIVGSIIMFCPPRHISSGGRANPAGIPYLYLCDNPDTVLYEIRASYLDEISIGEFQIKQSSESINIVDFTALLSLFQPNKVALVIKSKLLKDRISKDLSKPMRRYDSELEYIPTQFICEYIKVFTGSKGIKFQSSLHPQGNNFVIFDESIMYCKKVYTTFIEELNLKPKEK